ncbi:GlyGly-CTERM sorting domain-containing protein [Fusobacterium sp.]|nr:GlyGly-CTERM sorting domain-containing protein [Fusobacterium sp.]MEE1475534.1 GlyGly-CTERM sorting domain-containing protein [Fusobacterium sp.]
MEVTIIVQHLTLNLDGGAILLLGLFLLFVILLVRRYK